MKIKAVKTHKIMAREDIFEILDRYLPSLKNNTIVAITSKIISICENNILKIENVNKEELVCRESDLYFLNNGNKYGVTLTIRNSILIPNAGIDESNGDGHYILWPSDPQKAQIKYVRML